MAHQCIGRQRHTAAHSRVMCNDQMEQAHAETSVAASEIYAAGNACKEFCHQSYVNEELGLFNFPKPILLQIDNAAAEVFADDTAMKSELKHIDVRQEWVRALRDSSVILTLHVCSADNKADFFTKILHPDTFKRLRDAMMKQLQQ